jgi:4-fold beta-flower domain-containing protein
MRSLLLALCFCALCFARCALAAEEVSLFDGSGHAVAYVATEDALTIYLWSGKPVAYLDGDQSGGYNVYGFNGRHLGWYLQGIIWDHQGAASCAQKERLMVLSHLEPLKSLKALKPLASLKELAPLRPLFTNKFGDTPCELLLGQGAES